MLHIRIFVAAVLVATALAVLPGSATANPRDSMLAQINAVRSYSGLHPLRGSSSLNSSAARYARYLMRQGYFGHASRIRASSSFRVLGEILEMHGGRGAQVGSTLRAWLNSPGHRDVLMSGRFYWIGLAKVSGRFRGHTSTIWVGQLGRH
jgi:uncharacterized protein YkwD